MAKKMIGLVISSLDSEGTLTLYEGIRDKAREYDFITQGCVIHPSHESTEIYNAGEFFIFESIDYTKFDGLIVALDTITSESTKQVIVDRLKVYTNQIIALDCELEGAYSISTSNYGSAKDLVLHLIDSHGKTKINYISGPATNSESQLRLQAYLDAMEERNLSTEDRVFEGSFFIDDGEDGLTAFEQSPTAYDYDAIVCGNDIQAISTLSALRKRGLRVPEDVAVTGFDDISDTVQISPNITTISKNISRIGSMAINLLNDIWNGEDVPKRTVAGSQIIYRESCGCTPTVDFSEEYKDRLLTRFVCEKSFRAANRSFVEFGTEVLSFREYLKLIHQFISKINPGQFAMFIYEEFAEIFELENYPTIEIPFADGTSGRMTNVVLYFNGQFVPLERRRPDMDTNFYLGSAMRDISKLPPLQFLNSPLHCMEQKIGMVTFGDSEFPMTHSAYFSWISSMNLTINRIYNKMLMTEMSRLDFLTNTYNRLGLDYYWSKFSEAAQKRNLPIGIMFADVNNLKLINDNYGHDDGDYAVTTVALALKQLERLQLKVFRYGGDEFIVLELDSSAERMEALKKKVALYLEEACRRDYKPYQLSASLGYFIRSAGSKASMAECIETADLIMYNEKQAFHRGDGDRRKAQPKE